jgi:hypothetical protein
MFSIVIKAQEPNFSIFGYKHMIGMAIDVLVRVEFNAAVASNITGCFEGHKYSIIVVM